ncbi:MAG: prolyl oligopeptidase family serine peptidase [Flavobacteriales bacterium]|nr:prolyl oligopeptidase family serine peptidase [Flavobacteriales bacterium]
MRACTTVLLALLPFALLAQRRVEGRVVDATTGEPLEYVSIGSMPSGAFTLSHTDGSFALTMPDSLLVDSVQFALLGFIRIAFPVQQWSGGSFEVRLLSSARELEPAQVVGDLREERDLGNRSHHLLFNYLLKAERPDQLIEIAQAIDLGPFPVPVRAVNLFISDTAMDSATFRIGFRGFDGERPTGPLVERVLVRRLALAPGWLRLGLEDEHIVLQGPIVVTVEVLPTVDAKPRYLSIGIRLGGGGPGFDRRSTFDEWIRMPHRYSINVTALVPKGRADDAPEDPDPYLRSVDVRPWSPAVQDSFAIAFGLPERYDPAHPGGYPTVYLLDANLYFNDVLETFRKEARKGSVPPVILVGVGYRDIAAMDSLRQRDYLFPSSDSVPSSGGGERFLAFLCEQLVPYVKQRYATDTARCAIAGHSFGGYFTLFALQHGLLYDDVPFTTFIAASPVVDYAQGALFDTMEGRSLKIPSDTVPVFISHGRGEDDPAMVSYVELAHRCIRTGLVERHYAAADHMGTALPSFTDGLKKLWGRMR